VTTSLINYVSILSKRVKFFWRHFHFKMGCKSISSANLGSNFNLMKVTIRSSKSPIYYQVRIMSLPLNMEIQVHSHIREKNQYNVDKPNNKNIEYIVRLFACFFDFYVLFSISILISNTVFIFHYFFVSHEWYHNK
jgi:hypothetical protein